MGAWQDAEQGVADTYRIARRAVDTKGGSLTPIGIADDAKRAAAKGAPTPKWGMEARGARKKLRLR